MDLENKTSILSTPVPLSLPGLSWLLTTDSRLDLNYDPPATWLPSLSYSLIRDE